MRSRHVERFNHDEDAAGYDRDVLDESDPIRAGYDYVLDWIAASAAAGPDSRVLELGSGTGNLSLRLPREAELVCVDVSREMTRIAREKLAGRSAVEFAEADLLEYFDRPGPDFEPFDAVVSSYAVHHLCADEKARLFERITARLRPAGRAVFGDLMFENPAARREILASYRSSGREALAADIEDEFFWDVDHATGTLRGLGLRATAKRFSELSWGIAAERAR